jgi:hypothetical protein
VLTLSESDRLAMAMPRWDSSDAWWSNPLTEKVTDEDPARLPLAILE